MTSRKGKYEHITPDLPRLGVEPDRRDVLDAVRAEVLAPFNIDRDPTPEHVPYLLDQAQDCIHHALIIQKRATAGSPGAVESNHSASSFARVYAGMRGIMDRVNAWKSSVQVLLDVYEQLMIEQMEAEGVASMRLADGASVSTFLEPYPQVQDKEAYRQWCVAQGLEKDMHLWPSKTAALVKEMLLNGEAEPPGVTTYAKAMVRLNKA